MCPPPPPPSSPGVPPTTALPASPSPNPVRMARGRAHCTAVPIASQAASTYLSFDVKKTMSLAQKLYEGGHITYMRTDSMHLSKDAVEACRQYIHEELGEEYVAEEPRIYTSGKGAQVR